VDPVRLLLYFFGGATITLSLLFVIYSQKYAAWMHGSKGRHLKPAGALFLMIACVSTALHLFFLPVNTLRLASLLLWASGILCLAYETLSVILVILKVYS